MFEIEKSWKLEDICPSFYRYLNDINDIKSNVIPLDSNINCNHWTMKNRLKNLFVQFEHVIKCVWMAEWIEDSFDICIYFSIVKGKVR